MTGQLVAGQYNFVWPIKDILAIVLTTNKLDMICLRKNYIINVYYLFVNN